MPTKIKESCYACNDYATSREHVPPKCLFPTELGVNLRKDLITVPSCDEHNGKKSDDDEILLASLADIIGCNDIGMLHKFTKVDSAIRRSGDRIVSFESRMVAFSECSLFLFIALATIQTML